MESIANGGEEEFQRSGGAEGSPVRSAGRDCEPVELREQELDRGKTHAGAGTSAEPDASSREQRENREATGAPIKQTTCGEGARSCLQRRRPVQDQAAVSRPIGRTAFLARSTD